MSAPAPMQPALPIPSQVPSVPPACILPGLRLRCNRCGEVTYFAEPRGTDEVTEGHDVCAPCQVVS